MSEKNRKQESPSRIRLHHRFLPTDESGVIAMFAEVASKLGLTIVKVQSHEFPDFFLEDEEGYPILAEAEYRSSNYSKHEHPTDPADGIVLIICWEHDDPSCRQPVIQLRTVVETPTGMFSNRVDARLEEGGDPQRPWSRLEPFLSKPFLSPFTRRPRAKT